MLKRVGVFALLIGTFAAIVPAKANAQDGYWGRPPVYQYNGYGDRCERGDWREAQRRARREEWREQEWRDSARLRREWRENQRWDNRYYDRNRPGASVYFGFER